MSMTTFLAGQLVGMFCAYLGVTILVPMVVFRRYLKHRSITNQLLLSFLFGNFYIIMIVQFFQLLKISNKMTLTLATVLPALISGIKLNQISIGPAVRDLMKYSRRIAVGRFGKKTVLLRIGNKVSVAMKPLLKKTGILVKEHFWEILLQIGLFLLLIGVYGRGIVQTYGYSASDIPVHNYWINALGKNNIFVAGVYPHGYHCMIYYLHEVFGFETYVLLSQFAFVQVFCIHFSLLYFLKLCCKARYIPYVAVLFYTAGDFFMSITYARFASTLPQEFGMIFILPGIYYGFEFFGTRFEEVKSGERKKESWYSLIGFAMSFGLTLSAHFYNTIIAGFFCVAMAIGYLFLFVRKQFFGNVVITCFVSVLIAILPMGIAFATGTPLEGSLYWARSVIVGESEETQDAESSESSEIHEGEVQEPLADNGAEVVVLDEGKESAEAGEKSDEEETEVSGGYVVTPVSFQDRIKQKLESLKWKIITINNVMKNCVWNYDSDWYVNLFWATIVSLFIFGTLYILCHRTCYGAMLISVAVYMIIMVLLLSAGPLDLIMLMDPARACIYFSYMVPLLVAMPLDAVAYFFMGGGRFKWAGNCMSFGCLLAMAIFLLGEGHVRSSFQVGGFETNEAITCLTNIMEREEDEMWTICSANDELRMCEERGYHYETITFLKNMENWNENTKVTMPTPKVFFFIEKIPLDYAVTYEGSGQTISREGAANPLSYSTGLTPYQGEQRWITMSRMYYWAQEFQRMYPNEMKVYLETDRFVCYVVEQNAYSLFNFAIDYGYNTRNSK